MLLLPLALAACVSSRAAPPAGKQAKAVPSGNEAAAVPPATESAPEQPGALQSVGESAGRIATQPVKDVGVAKTKFPPVLLAAREDPYSLKGLKSCKQIAAAFRDLTEALGPDFQPGDIKKENRAGKLAEAGGQTVVNSLIPFRGLVREISGAAPAQRRLNQAIDAGYARRGFLRGVYTSRKCRPALGPAVRPGP